MDAGYDDIDFISDITSEELEDIGITKKGGCGHSMVGMCVVSMVDWVWSLHSGFGGHWDCPGDVGTASVFNIWVISHSQFLASQDKEHFARP